MFPDSTIAKFPVVRRKDTCCGAGEDIHRMGRTFSKLDVRLILRTRS